MIDILSLNSGKITNLRRVTYLVLDEADRMFGILDGFTPKWPYDLPENVQTCTLSRARFLGGKIQETFFKKHRL